MFRYILEKRQMSYRFVSLRPYKVCRDHNSNRVNYNIWWFKSLPHNSVIKNPVLQVYHFWICPKIMPIEFQRAIVLNTGLIMQELICPQYHGYHRPRTVNTSVRKMTSACSSHLIQKREDAAWNPQKGSILSLMGFLDQSFVHPKKVRVIIYL